jgi:TatD DNase family protein
MIFDTHSHCYWDSLLPRIDEVIANMRVHSVSHAIQIGCDFETSREAIHLAQKHSDVFFATVGFHPENAQDVVYDSEEGRRTQEALESLIRENRESIVALGETGLDFHYLDGTLGGTKPLDWDTLSPKAQAQIQNQKDWWIFHRDLGRKYSLPLVIHSRDAREETLDFMLSNDISRAVMHCFAEDADFARTLMEFSPEIYFSFSGIVTYKNAPKIQEAACMLPLDRILTETDAPFLSPQSVR